MTDDSDLFRAQGHAIVDLLADHLKSARRRDPMPVMPPSEPEAMAARFPVDGAGGGDLLAFAQNAIDQSMHQHHPRCVGHQVAVPDPVAPLFDLLGSVLNNGMASYESGPASSAMERNVVRWLAKQLGWTDEADGFLTSGGTLGNLTALLAARQERAGYDVWREGAHQRPLAVLTSEHAHYCVSRAVQVMGWGTDGAIAVPVDEHHHLRAAALADGARRAREGGRHVIAVVATAGSTPTGAFDPLEEIGAFCREHDLWLHVDGAHGASVALSPRYRSLLAGIERADSVVWDAHKLMRQSALATAVLFRRTERSYQAFSQQAAYLYEDSGERVPWFDYGQRNMECTKRMMSLTLYGLLHVTGAEAIGSYVTAQLDLARAFAERIESSDDFELTARPEANIVCFRHRSSDDAQQDALRKRVIQSGRYFLTRTTLAGRTTLRVTLMNPHTSLADLDGLLAALRDAAG